MRLLLSILLGSVTAMAWASEEPALTRYTLDDLDPAVKAEVERALQEADRARVAYLQAIQRANEAAVQRIDRQIQAQTRRGNLDGALAARQMVELLNEGWLKEQAEAEFDLLGNQVVNKEQLTNILLVGSWRTHDGRVHVLHSNNELINQHGIRGTWKLDSKLLLTLNFGGTEYNIIRINDDVTSFTDGITTWNKVK